MEGLLFKILSIGFGLLAAYVSKKVGKFIDTKVDSHVSLSQKEAAYEFIEAGVEDTYNTYIRELKEAGKDGELTSEERAEARRKALSVAKDAAKEKGLDLMKIHGEAVANKIIETIVRKRKRTGEE